MYDSDEESYFDEPTSKKYTEKTQSLSQEDYELQQALKQSEQSAREEIVRKNSFKPFKKQPSVQELEEEELKKAIQLSEAEKKRKPERATNAKSIEDLELALALKESQLEEERQRRLELEMNMNVSVATSRESSTPKVGNQFHDDVSIAISRSLEESSIYDRGPSPQYRDPYPRPPDPRISPPFDAPPNPRYGYGHPPTNDGRYAYESSRAHEGRSSPRSGHRDPRYAYRDPSADFVPPQERFGYTGPSYPSYPTESRQDYSPPPGQGYGPSQVNPRYSPPPGPTRRDYRDYGGQGYPGPYYPSFDAPPQDDSQSVRSLSRKHSEPHTHHTSRSHYHSSSDRPSPDYEGSARRRESPSRRPHGGSSHHHHQQRQPSPMQRRDHHHHHREPNPHHADPYDHAPPHRSHRSDSRDPLDAPPGYFSSGDPYMRNAGSPGLRSGSWDPTDPHGGRSRDPRSMSFKEDRGIPPGYKEDLGHMSSPAVMPINTSVMSIPVANRDPGEISPQKMPSNRLIRAGSGQHLGGGARGGAIGLSAIDQEMRQNGNALKQRSVTPSGLKRNGSGVSVSSANTSAPRSRAMTPTSYQRGIRLGSRTEMPKPELVPSVDKNHRSNRDMDAVISGSFHGNGMSNIDKESSGNKGFDVTTMRLEDLNDPMVDEYFRRKDEFSKRSAHSSSQPGQSPIDHGARGSPGEYNEGRYQKKEQGEPSVALSHIDRQHHLVGDKSKEQEEKEKEDPLADPRVQEFMKRRELRQQNARDEAMAKALEEEKQRLEAFKLKQQQTKGGDGEGTPEKRDTVLIEAKKNEEGVKKPRSMSPMLARFKRIGSSSNLNKDKDKEGVNSPKEKKEKTRGFSPLKTVKKLFKG